MLTAPSLVKVPPINSVAPGFKATAPSLVKVPTIDSVANGPSSNVAPVSIVSEFAVPRVVFMQNPD